MKLITLFLLVGVLIGCNKESSGIYQTSKTPDTGETVPEKASVSIKLYQDTVNSDETTIVFSSAATSAYSPMKDALYFPGSGQVSLSSLSSDGRDLAIYTLPYTAGGMIAFDINTKKDGQFFLAESRGDLPPTLEVWLKDAETKDSVALSTNTYSFTVSKTDTNSYGKRRFKLLIRPKR